MTLVVGIFIAVGLVLLLSWIAAAAATAIVGTAIAALSGPYSGVRAVIRHRLARSAAKDDEAPGIMPVRDSPLGNELRTVIVRPAGASRLEERDWGWLRPVAGYLVVAGVTFLLDGSAAARRRRPARAR